MLPDGARFRADAFLENRMATLLLRNIAWLYTCDDGHRCLRNAYVHIVDGRVAAIGNEPAPMQGADRQIDLAGCIVIPGLVNLHHHFFQSITRAIPLGQRATAFDWLFAMYPLWAELDEESMQAATMAAGAELLLTGCTTSVDHSYLIPAGSGDLPSAEVRAAGRLGLRLHLVRGCMPTMEGDVAERLAPLMGDRLGVLLDDPVTVARAMRDVLDRFHDRSPLAMVRVAVGPTTVPYRLDGLMRDMAAMSREYDCGLHTHYQPRETEARICRESHGLTPIDYLEQAGWLTPRTWFAHCTELSDHDIRGFARSGAGVAHCPRTAVRLGYKVPRIAAMRQAGVRVGVGIDGAASNDGGGMINEVRLAHLLHRLDTGPQVVPEQDWMSPYETLLMATRDGAAILGRDDIGYLAPGMAADIAAFDMRCAGLSGAAADPLGGLILAGSDARTVLTVVNGRVIVESGVLMTASERDVVEGANAAAERMLRAGEKRTGIPFRESRGAGPKITIVG